ncbi:hypothetical protein JCM8547_004094 [Rhodosporidiobolus lusitaniae]
MAGEHFQQPLGGPSDSQVPSRVPSPLPPTLPQHASLEAVDSSLSTEKSAEEHEEDVRRREELDTEAAGVEEENRKLKERLRMIEDELEKLQDEAEASPIPSGLITPTESSLLSLESELYFLLNGMSLSLLPSPLPLLLPVSNHPFPAQAEAPSPAQDPSIHRSECVALEAAFWSLRDTVGELGMAKEWEEKRKGEEEGLMERDTQLLADARLLNSILSKRVSDSRSSSSPGLDGEVVVLRTQARASLLSARFRELQQGLVQFIDERLVSDELDEEGYPPAQERGKKGKAMAFDLRAFIRSEGLGEPAEKRAFELKKLIEALMNRLVTSPSSPFLSLSSLSPQPSPELVQFLLGAGIVREDARDAGRVMLVDFGTA